MLTNEEREALFFWNSLPGMYHKKLFAIYRAFGSFAEALCTPVSEYCRRGVLKKDSPVLTEALQNRALQEKQKTAFRRLPEIGIRMIDFTEEAMPVRLRTIPEPPAVLFVKGRLPDDSLPSLSIIGARQCSEYGRSAAEDFARIFAENGIQIISGMAYGIDSAALFGGLTAGNGCFAVLGSGPDLCYPPTSRRIYDALITGAGGVCSEYNPGQPAQKHHFILRNRLISALGDALFVAEAKEKSGTSITVDFALEQGKDVFALPGRVTDPLGKGCNRLIRDGAMILTEPEDLLTYFGISGKQRTGNGKTPVFKDPAGQKVYQVLSCEPKHLEEISESTGFPVPELLFLLSQLETQGLVRAAGGAYYKKVPVF